MSKQEIKKQLKSKILDPLPKDIYEILACPIDKFNLKYTNDKTGLRCIKCKHVYPIIDGIPNLLPPEININN